MKGDVAVIGLGVMGANIAENIKRNGFNVTIYNRSPESTKKLIEADTTGRFIAATDLADLTSKLNTPRLIFLMVNAGTPVDSVIEGLSLHLSRGDVVADLGNSHYTDTKRRVDSLAKIGVDFLGVGVSGGEEGALHGASIMAGGPKNGWSLCAKIFDAISAKVDRPCHAYIGPDGAGHFVKMVHNGIEYADMQLIAEIYQILRQGLDQKPKEISALFNDWNKGELSSFLIEITAKIFEHEDPKGGFLVDHILDRAAQKGTGKWTIQAALDLGITAPTIAAALDTRTISSDREIRVEVEKLLGKDHASTIKQATPISVEKLHDALFAGKILAYTQGFALIAKASDEWDWNIQLSELAAIWRGGCIIRAKLLSLFESVLKEESAKKNMLLSPAILKELTPSLRSLREVVAYTANCGIPAPGLSSALAYFDAIRSSLLPTNLIQAQRDFFGAHTFERTDEEGKFHVKWV